jgi:hypothetical protein
MNEARPDPYPAAPAVPATHPSAPAQTQPPVARVVQPTVVRTPVHRSPVVRRKPRPAPAKPIRLPTHPAPGLDARVVAAVFEPQQRVSRALALAVASLVLLSAAFVAGAAREVAR